jgi:L-alanine-DL-glutamate epimerase-like enolase superfamily enzyme
MTTDALTRITSVEVAPLNVPLREPFGIAGGTQVIAANVLVLVRLADGTTGYGEAAPLPAYNGETQSSTLEALNRARNVVEGADACGWRALARRLGEVIPGAGAARCALETAALDALMRQRGFSLHAFFGGAERTLESDITITTGTVEDAWAAARRWADAGFTMFKIKVGAGELDGDVARVAAVRDAAPHGRILVDANASLRAHDAIYLVKRLKEQGIDIALFEQPTPVGDWEALEEVAKHVVVVLDENVVTAADALRAARLGYPHIINVKLMKAGIAEALDVAGVARAAGMRLMIGGNVESILAMTVSACFSAGQGGFANVDLDTPLFLSESPFHGGFTMRGPVIELPVSAVGHGVSPALGGA